MQRRSWVVLATTLALSAGALTVLRRPPEAGMRRLQLAHLTPADVDTLELSGARQVVLRRDGAVWRLANHRAADPALIERALKQLAQVRSDAFISADADRLAEFHLAGEQALTVCARGQKRALRTLVLGGNVPPRADGQQQPTFAVQRGPQRYVRANNEVFAVDAEQLDALDRDAESFEERSFWAEQEPEIAAYVVRRGDGTGYALERGAEGWRLGAAPNGVRPESSPRRFDAQQASQLVTRLGQSRALALVDQDPGEDVTKLGAGADVVAWRLTEAAAAAGGVASRTLTLGAPRDEGGVWARLEGRPLPFVLDAGVAEELRRPAVELADLTLMAPFDVDAATELTIEPRPGARLSFRRHGDAWRLERGAKLVQAGVPDPTKLRARMRQLALARALGLAPGRGVPNAPTPASRRGGGRIAVRLADGSTHALQFGGEVGLRGMQARYAQGDADGQTYIASRPLRENLVGKLDELVRRPGATTQAAAAAPAGPQGLDSLPPEVQESIRRQLAGAAGP